MPISSTKNPNQARRCLPALEGKKEHMLLEERCALCSIAQDISQRLTTLDYSTLVTGLETLRNHYGLFPIPLTVKVTTKIYTHQYQRLLSSLDDADEEFSKDVAHLVSTFALWNKDKRDHPELMDAENPSFQPLVTLLNDQFGKGDDDDDVDSNPDDESAADDFDELMRQSSSRPPATSKDADDGEAGEIKQQQEERRRALEEYSKAGLRKHVATVTPIVAEICKTFTQHSVFSTVQHRHSIVI